MSSLPAPLWSEAVSDMRDVLAKRAVSGEGLCAELCSLFAVALDDLAVVVRRDELRLGVRSPALDAALLDARPAPPPARSSGVRQALARALLAKAEAGTSGGACVARLPLPRPRPIYGPEPAEPSPPEDEA